MMGSGIDIDDLPLAERRRRLLQPGGGSGSSKSPDRSSHDSAGKGDSKAASPQNWPGLPRGVFFNPSDADILWHLITKVGTGKATPHPFIGYFIECLDEDKGFRCMDPRNLIGVKPDGRVSYFFHRTSSLHNEENKSDFSWQKVGKPRPVFLDGSSQGCKQVYSLHVSATNSDKPEKTRWLRHEYRVGAIAEGSESELVISKIFYRKPKEDVINANELGRGTLDASTESISRVYEVDHACLHERRRNLLSEKDSCPSNLDAFWNNSKENSDKPICNEAGGLLLPGHGSNEMDNKGTPHGQYLLSMLQEVSSAPLIMGEHDTTELQDEDETNRLLRIGQPNFQAKIKLEPSWDDRTNPIGSSVGNSSLTETTRSLLELSPEDVLMEAEPLHGNGRLVDKSSAELILSKQTVVPGDVLMSRNSASFLSSIPPHDSRNIPHPTTFEVQSSFKDQVPVKTKLIEYEELGVHEKNSINFSQPNRAKSRVRNEDVVEDAVYSTRRRKRRKTATDSVEKALEEDAPGLLKVLLDKGITMEEIKLYGAEEEDEVLESLSENDFEDLEAVITKLFPERASLWKFPTIKCMKGSKAVYCLACLISLIEQARYLRFRNSPVEWGWCRDLQSFIFIFTRHNRIVLERPEYGYATYFFEIVHSLPIEWQIKRLVTAMKLSSCSRACLIENRPLLVGEDMTEGEARVLEEYGWTPNSGLGTMLNYCDRVVHDRRNETYSSEWRVKIGKLLVNGYDGGCAFLSDVPKKIGKFESDQNMEIKMEYPV